MNQYKSKAVTYLYSENDVIDIPLITDPKSVSHDRLSVDDLKRDEGISVEFYMYFAFIAFAILLTYLVIKNKREQ